MKHARVSPNEKARVHLIPPTDRPDLLGHQNSLCGQIPITDLERWGNPRWFWTEDSVDCQVCLRRSVAGHTRPRGW